MNDSIQALQGKIFQVKLKSSMSSTDYGWCLASMPEEVALASIEYEAGKPGSEVTQVFNFIALKQIEDKKTAQIVFKLLRLFEPKKETKEKIDIDVSDKTFKRSKKKKDEITIDVSIIPDKLESLARLDSLNEKYINIKLGFNPIDISKEAAKYGFPDVTNRNESAPVEPTFVRNDVSIAKYGFFGVTDDRPKRKK